MVNPIPKPISRLEIFYGLSDKFKRVVNYETNNSSMSYAVINLGTETNPQHINLGTNCTLMEKVNLIRLLKEYKDVFAWTYDNLKSFDPNIMQHNIPIKLQSKPFQYKLRKMHPSLEPIVKSELNRILVAKIIFLVYHTKWVANLVSVWKKTRDIHLCVDFINLNKASYQENYPIPPMDQILQRVSSSKTLSLLDDFLGYN